MHCARYPLPEGYKMYFNNNRWASFYKGKEILRSGAPLSRHKSHESALVVFSTYLNYNAIPDFPIIMTHVIPTCDEIEHTINVSSDVAIPTSNQYVPCTIPILFTSHWLQRLPRCYRARLRKDHGPYRVAGFDERARDTKTSSHSKIWPEYL